MMKIPMMTSMPQCFGCTVPGVLDMFDLKTQNADDFAVGLQHDLAEITVDFAALRRCKGQPLSDLEKRALEVVFKNVDTHHTDRITRDELKEYFQSNFNALSPAELDEMMDIADTDGSGDLDKQEFLTLAKKLLEIEHSHSAC